MKPTGGDRISALPEPNLHHILSFLPPKYVKVTSSLSKTWYYHISPSFPFLDFDDFPANRYEKDIDKYLNYVDKTLSKFHSHNELNLEIKRLTLNIPMNNLSSRVVALLDSWISLVLQHGIHELNLGFRNCRVYYNLPRLVLVAKSIKVVKLVGCRLSQTFPYNHPTNLLKLCLDNVVLDDVILRSIISACPLIEDLAILSCVGIKRVQISNLSKLKTLRISHGWINKEGIEMVEIGAPSLQSLYINVSVKIPVLECPMLMDLDLNEVVFEEFQLQDFLLNLSYLRSLSLFNLTSLTRLNMSSDTLKKLKIIGCDNLVKLKIDTPNLCLFQSDHCAIASASKQYAVYITCQRYGDNHKVNPLTIEDFIVAMRNFVSKASHLEKFSLRLYIIQPIKFDDLNKRVVQPVVNINHLSLVLEEINDFSQVSYLDLFECVFWICHPCTLSFIYPNKDVVMSICKVIGHRHLPCNPSRSWLHCLEQVKYVARDESKGQLPMDGISLPWLRISYRKIKLVFKW